MKGLIKALEKAIKTIEIERALKGMAFGIEDMLEDELEKDGIFVTATVDITLNHIDFERFEGSAFEGLSDPKLDEIIDRINRES